MPRTKRECLPESVRYIEIQQGTDLQFSTTKLIMPDTFLPPVKVYRRGPSRDAPLQISALLVVYGTIGFNKITPLHVELHNTCLKSAWYRRNATNFSAMSQIYGT